METPNRSKKRRNDVDDTSTTSRSSWVVPAFPSSPSPKRKHIARSKPSSTLGPTLGPKNAFNTTQKPLKRLSHDPRHLFTPPASTSDTSPKNQPAAPSFKPLNLNPKFKESTSPKRLSSTSDPRNPQPPARSLANKGWPSSPSHSSFKPLKQISSTTRLALFPTPRKLEDETMEIDAGAGQVAMRNLNSPDAFASFLTPHDKPPKEVSAHDSEISRGMDLSPEKGDRNWKGKSKFVKNGLAERATMLISRAQNDLSLWSHDISRSISSIPSSLAKPHSSNRPSSNTPDLRLVVKKILLDWKTREAVLEALNAETMSFSSRLLGAPYALARCEVLRRAGSSSAKGKERAGTDSSSEKPDTVEQLVLFSFSTASSSSAAAARVSSVVGFGEGKEVMVWKPWIDIELPSGENETGAFVEVAVVDPPDHATAEGGEPSTIPHHEDILSFGDELPIGKGIPPANVTKHRALLCSRFAVVR